MDAGTAQRGRGGAPSQSSKAGAWSLAIGGAWALAFLLLATPRIDVPGLYYDEVHQVPAAFALTEAPHSVAAYSIAGLPILNMPYSGAIKSGLYGLGLRAFDYPFTVRSWRLFGCGIAALGIFFVCAAFASALSWPSAMVMGALLVTDVTVLLATRHDWGPVSLALSIRLSLLALWIRDWQRQCPRLLVSFGLGSLLGLAIFEKLSSVVLIIPVLMAFLLDARRRDLQHWAAGFSGGLIGVFPLLVVNLHSWLTQGSLISLASTLPAASPAPPFWDFLAQYEGLAAGSTLTSWILGQPPLVWATPIEGLGVGVTSLVVLGASLAAGSSARVSLAAGALVLIHLAVGFAVIALPSTTWIHHWVIGTPFQYAAFAFATQAIIVGELQATPARRALRVVFLAILSLLLCSRIPPLVIAETAMQNGSTSPNFEPSTLRLGEFVLRQPRDSVFLATEWGVSLPILCLSNGEVFVPEIYWNYTGPADLLRAVGDAPRFFLVAWQAAGTQQGKTDQILADARRLQGFQEQPVGPEAAYWRTTRAWRFDRSGQR